MTTSQPDGSGRRVSAVVPTRNRPDSVVRLLRSLERQTRLPNEVIIVDASSTRVPPPSLAARFPSLNVRVVVAHPSVSFQRNQGITLSRGQFILLADDDIEFPPPYIESLLEFLRDHPGLGAVSGTLREASGNSYSIPDQIPISPLGLVWNFIFQTSVWGDLGPIEKRARLGPLLRPLCRYYHRRANAYTFAGWPTLTETSGPFFRTAVYGLGGAMIRRDWLQISPYDEVLDEHGIGDNFGVALGFPQPKPLCVLTSVSYLHHREPSNRLSSSEVHHKRIMALDYFMSRSPHFSGFNRAALRWSVLGHFLYYLRKGSLPMATASLTSLGRLLIGRNPYLIRRSNFANATIDSMVDSAQFF